MCKLERSNIQNFDFLDSRKPTSSAITSKKNLPFFLSNRYTTVFLFDNWKLTSNF